MGAMLTDRGTEYCGKLETHDYQFYLLSGHKRNRAHQDPCTSSANKRHLPTLPQNHTARVLPSCLQAEIVSFSEKCYRHTWGHGWSIIIRKGRTKEKCAAAARLSKCSLTEKSFGRKRSDSSTNLTTGTIKMELCVRQI